MFEVGGGRKVLDGSEGFGAFCEREFAWGRFVKVYASIVRGGTYMV